MGTSVPAWDVPGTRTAGAVTGFALAVLAVLALGYMVLRTRQALLACWFLVMIGRWLSGGSLSGEPVTNAGLFRWGEGRALTRTGHAHSWWYRPRWQRALHRTSGTLLAVVIAYGLLAAFWLTVALILTALFLVFVFACWRAWVWFTCLRRDRKWVIPVHRAAHQVAGVPRAISARKWIDVQMEVDGSVREVRLSLPQHWQSDPKEEQRLAGIVAAKTGIELPEVSWQRPGPAAAMIIRHGAEPPSLYEYGRGSFGEQLAEALERKRQDEILFGLGKPVKGRYPPVKASLKLQSPHFLVAMGTGAGKSELASFLTMQVLRLGAVVMVLDYKWSSLAWTIKDENADYDFLPNVAYLQTIPQIHAGLVWLGRELRHRNQETERRKDVHGNIRGSIGPPIWIIAEELNYVTPELRDYWTETRQKDQPKKSPALSSLAAVSFAGRAVDMHEVLIGQMLTADVTGSRDNSVKANIGVKAMARYGAPEWQTAVGKNVPMPPSPSVLGRIQLVTPGGTYETQTPKADYPLYRELATSGVLTPCPDGMPRIGSVPGTPQLPPPPPDMQVVPRTFPSLGPPEAVALSEAAWKVVDRSLDALRKASQRPGFPTPVGIRGQAYLYDPVELAKWDAGRR